MDLNAAAGPNLAQVRPADGRSSLHDVVASQITCACAAAARPGRRTRRRPIAPGDYVSSDNIERVGSIRTVGDGVGATIVGNYIFVTSTPRLSVLDISNAEVPAAGRACTTLDVEWENEEVPTNGKILGISGTINCPDPTAINGTAGTGATGCLTLYDVSDPERDPPAQERVGRRPAHFGVRSRLHVVLRLGRRDHRRARPGPG